MIVTRKQLQLFESLAIKGYMDTPANLQFGDDTPLNDSEFRHFVMLRAALSVLKSIDLDLADSGITVELAEPFKS